MPSRHELAEGARCTSSTTRSSCCCTMPLAARLRCNCSPLSASFSSLVSRPGASGWRQLLLTPEPPLADEPALLGLPPLTTPPCAMPATACLPEARPHVDGGVGTSSIVSSSLHGPSMLV